MPGLHDFVIVFGPGHEPSDIRKIRSQFKNLALSLLIVGDGRSEVTKAEFLKNAQGKVRPDAPAVFFFHSGVENGELYLQVKPGTGSRENLASSTEVLQWTSELTAPSNPAALHGGAAPISSGPSAGDPSPADTVPWDGTRHLFGCYSGAADPAIRSMPADPGKNDSGAVILHNSKKDIALVQQDMDHLSALGIQCAEHKRENRSAGAYRQFAEGVQRFPNTMKFSVPGDQEKLGVKTAKTQGAILGKSLQQEFTALQARAEKQKRGPEAVSIFAEFSGNTIDAESAAQRRLDAWFLLVARSALHTDAAHVEAVKAMLQSDPALLQAGDKDGWNVVMHAIHLGCTKLLTALFSNASEEQRQDIVAAVNAGNKEQLPVICLAAHLGNDSAVSWLLQHGARLDACDPNGDDTLTIAIKRGDYKVIAALCRTDSADVRAAINRKNRNGDTALHLAIRNGFHDIVELLLEGGALCDAVDDQGRNAIMIAVDRSDERMIAVLSRANEAGLRAAINTGDRNGITALHLAINNGLPETARWLIRSGAQGEATDRSGRNAWMVAARNDSTDILDMLYDAAQPMGNPGVHINAKDKRGNTALHLAAAGNSPQAFNWLLANGARMDAITDNGSHVVMIAVTSGRHEILQQLEGPNLSRLINTPVGDRSALSEAVICGDIRVVNWLLENGAAIDEAARNFADGSRNHELIGILNAPDSAHS